VPLVNEDPAIARRALAYGLLGYLDAPRVKQAVELWHAEFEGEQSMMVGLNRYCRQVAKVFGLQGKEAELHLRVFRAMQADPKQLPSDPLASTLGLTADQASTLPADAGAHGAGVMEAFFATVERCIAREGAENELRKTLVNHASKLPLRLQKPLVAWWSGAGSGLDGDWPPAGAGTQVVNLIYVALAECLGPTRADKVFTETVALLERSDDPVKRTIRRYL
jgi:hypothetical protein